MLVASRNPGRGRVRRTATVGELPTASVELVTLDLADLDSVQRLAGQLGPEASGSSPGCTWTGRSHIRASPSAEPA